MALDLIFGKSRPVASSIIGGGGTYLYIRVLHNYFVLKSIVFMVCEHEYMNMCPPPTIELVTCLQKSSV